MGISILTGQCWRTIAQSIPGFEPVAGRRIPLLGARDLEPPEETLLADLDVRRELGEMGDVYAAFRPGRP
jgi:arginase